MGTMNFSVPEDVKQDFDRTFAGENKSAVLTDLMRQAIEERRRRARRAQAIGLFVEPDGQVASEWSSP